MSEDSQELIKIFDSFWDWRMSRSPEFASLAGDRRFDGQLETYTTQRFNEDKQTCLDFQKRLKDTGSDTLNARLLRDELDTFIGGHKFSGWLFPLNFMEGVHVDFQRLPEWMNVDAKNGHEDLLARYDAFPEFSDGICQVLKEAADKKMICCDRSMKGVLKAFKEIAESAPEDTDYFQPFKAKEEPLRQRALKSISANVQPSMRKIQGVLERDYLPHLRTGIAATSLPDGEEFYRQCLKFHTSGSLKAEEIHAIGLKEVDRIEKEMKEILKELGAEGKPLKEFFAELRGNKEFYFGSPKELMDRFRFLLDQKINPKLSDLFWAPPNLPLEIVEMPEAMSGGPAAYYIAGTTDGSRPGRFFVNTKRFDSQPKYEMISLALHEGNPGHHLQNSYSMCVQPPLPKFRQTMEDRCYCMAPSRFPIHTSFMEGWALYCEGLGFDLELYGDPYDRFGHLSEEIFRASRLVVDTGVHALGWSRQRAVDFMKEHTAASADNIESEIDRYITWPGQAVGYKIGQLKISELRKKAENELGSKFDIRDFHEVVLRSAGPLTVVESEVLSYISGKKGKSPP